MATTNLDTNLPTLPPLFSVKDDVVIHPANDLSHDLVFSFRS